jgi:hypothetical protein
MNVTAVAQDVHPEWRGLLIVQAPLVLTRSASAGASVAV